MRDIPSLTDQELVDVMRAYARQRHVLAATAPRARSAAAEYARRHATERGIQSRIAGLMGVTRAAVSILVRSQKGET